jgi:hypothetical protein
MFRLIRFVISLAMLVAFIWFSVNVPLGKRTLWGHVLAIFGTQEAKDLADGTRQEAHKVAERVREELRPQDMGLPPRKVRPPLDPVENRERHRLDHLVKQKTR